MSKPILVKVVSMQGNDIMVIPTAKIPKGLKKTVIKPHDCGLLYNGDVFYGTYKYIY
jgi:hypothetical protein